MESRPGTTRRHLATSPFKPITHAAPAEYAADDRVTHDRFGLGTVVSTEGSSFVTVRFTVGLVRVANNDKLQKL
ncbi:hypothetical protein NUM3379_41720 [Kineococcus sp. NUM-3379]